MDLYDETWRLLGALEARGVAYALVGAVALAIHGAPRATTDIDLLVRPEDVDRARQTARELGFVREAYPMKFHDGMELRRLSKASGEEILTLDLLVVNPNLEAVWAGRVRVETEHGILWAASREGLIRMKTWAGRPQDIADIRRLEDLDR